MDTLAQTLSAARAQRGLSQRQLAVASGLTCAYVRTLESADTSLVPSTDAVISLALALQLDPWELLDAAGRAPSAFDVASLRLGAR